MEVDKIAAMVWCVHVRVCGHSDMADGGITVVPRWSSVFGIVGWVSQSQKKGGGHSVSVNGGEMGDCLVVAMAVDVDRKIVVVGLRLKDM